MSESPKVSVCLVCFNQARFIREALTSLLAQDYSNMEIIVSDDCSTDDTRIIAKQVAQTYSGSVKVVITSTPENSGLAENLNHAVSLSTGEFIVIQAGDDVSLPTRVSRLVHAWKMSSADLLVSDVTVIDDKGSQLREGWSGRLCYPGSVEEAVYNDKCYAIGCAAAFRRDIITDFGYLPRDVISEDWVTAFRALLRNGVHSVPERLLKYRLHDSNIWHGQTQNPTDRSKLVRQTRNRVAIAREWLRAWEFVGRPKDALWRRLVQNERRWKYELLCLETTRLRAAFHILCGLNDQLSLKSSLGLVKRHLLFAHASK